VAHGTTQFDLNFDAGLTDQFPNFDDVLHAIVYSGCRPAKAIAADLDLSQSMLTRMINQQDHTVNFPARRLGELIAATDDRRPVYWLVEKFCQDSDAQARQNIAELAAMLPKLVALVEHAQNDERMAAE